MHRGRVVGVVASVRLHRHAVTELGDPVAYYVSWCFPARGPGYATAKVEWAHDVWIAPGSGTRIWSGRFETLAKIGLGKGRWGEGTRQERLLWRTCLAHRAGRRVPDDELDAWLARVPGPGLRSTADEMDRFFEAGQQLQLL